MGNCKSLDIVEDVISDMMTEMLDDKKFKAFVYLYVNAKYKNNEQKKRLKLHINKYLEKNRANNIDDNIDDNDEMVGARESLSEQASE